MQVPEARAPQEHRQRFGAVSASVGAGAHREKKGQLSFSPIGKWLVERWVGRKWALENPLCSLARCLPGVWAVWELIYNLSGKLGDLTKRALPLTAGKQEVTKETSHGLGVTFGHRALQMHGRSGRGCFCFCALGTRQRQLCLSTRGYPEVGEAQGCSCHAWEGSEVVDGFVIAKETIVRWSWLQKNHVSVGQGLQVSAFVACVSVILSPSGREQTAAKSRIWYLS